MAMHACRTGRRRRCTPEIGFRSRPVDARRVAADSTATSVTRLELLVVTRNNSNTGTELAANASLHPISCCALWVGPRWFVGSTGPDLAQAPPARQASWQSDAWHMGIGGDDGAPSRRRDQRRS
jgi:hypothetical protein